MLIEIRDLPEGQKIKQIRVDVTFEDDETTPVKASIDTVPERTKEIHETRGVTSQEQHDSVIDKPVIDTNRPSKEIPQEMLEQEF